MMIKSRDIVQCSLVFKGGPDGETWYVIAHSVETEKCPPIKESVRGDLNFMIWELAPKEGGKASYITKMFRIDPKGSIPDMIKNKIIKKGGLEIEAIKNALLD